MSYTTQKELLDAGVHFGHLTSKWHPKMAPYIFMERNGIHVLDLNKTEVKLNEACAALKQMVKSGKKILFVATKKQAKDIVAQVAKDTNMPYVTERWLGGMMTNFGTVRKSIKKMNGMDKFTKESAYENLSKREKLMLSRDQVKLERLFGGISDLTRLPGALFIVDIKKEHIAVEESKKLNIPTFAMVDTNSDPTLVDFAIPSNDDATKSIGLVTSLIAKAIQEGLAERKKDATVEKEGADVVEGDDAKEGKRTRKKVVVSKEESPEKEG